MQISVSQLSKRYPGGKLALKNVDLEIPKGLFGLLGPNGAGKTTLMRILVTLLKPTSGQVKVNDLDIRKNRKEIRRQIGYLPQDFSVFAKLTVWGFMDYSACLNGILSKNKRRDRIDLLLESVGLFEARDVHDSELTPMRNTRFYIRVEWCLFALRNHPCPNHPERSSFALSP